MKTYFKILLFAFVAISGLNSCSSDSETQTPIENQLLDLFQKSDLEKNVIVLTSVKDNKIEYTIHDGWEFAWDDTQNRGGDIVCQGSGISFAKCVRDYVDGGGCCIVYKSGNTYYAKKTTCPISGT